MLHKAERSFLGGSEALCATSSSHWLSFKWHKSKANTVFSGPWRAHTGCCSRPGAEWRGLPGRTRDLPNVRARLHTCTGMRCTERPSDTQQAAAACRRTCTSTWRQAVLKEAAACCLLLLLLLLLMMMTTMHTTAPEAARLSPRVRAPKDCSLRATAAAKRFSPPMAVLISLRRHRAQGKFTKSHRSTTNQTHAHVGAWLHAWRRAAVWNELMPTANIRWGSACACAPAHACVHTFACTCMSTVTPVMEWRKFITQSVDDQVQQLGGLAVLTHVPVPTESTRHQVGLR